MKTPLGITFVIAASLLGVAAVAQLVAVLVYFGPGLKQTYGAAQPAPAQEAALPAPRQVTEEDQAALAARFSALAAEADKLEAGATPGEALAPLEQALALQPGDPALLARIATLHERLGQTDQAAASWGKLVALGASAGNLREIAEVRLNLLRSPAPSGDGVELRDQTGLQPGSSLGIVDLKMSDGGDASVPVKDLRLAVKARPGEQIEASDVRINVTFYETLNGEIVPTMSRVQSMWFTTPVDWKSDGVEILEVKYEVPRLGPDGGPPPDFYGYMVNIYHRGQLQETIAEPADLRELFPAPLNELPAGGQDGAGGAQ